MHGSSTACLSTFSTGGETHTQAAAAAAAAPPTLCGRREARHLLQLIQWSPGCIARRFSRTYGRERWVAPRGLVHNLGRLCTHIHLHQWATGKCKPKVIAPDKNICLVNKYSNEGSSEVPQTDARLTGLQRDRRYRSPPAAQTVGGPTHPPTYPPSSGC